jgi:hypothetical protein
MRKLSFRDTGEEHNFWQNYTDLMSGFLIVFIITSLVAYGSYKVYVDLYHSKGITEANINDIVVNAELYKKISDFQKVSKELGEKSKYFKYNDEFKRFECNIDVQFEPNEAVIKEQYKADLIAAGRELESLVSTYQNMAENIAFKIIIDGRAANNLTSTLNGGKPWVKGDATWKEMEVRSYERARAVRDLWDSNGIFHVDTNHSNLDVIISGSGFGGTGRYKQQKGSSVDNEARNKTFIIQIIPYINF